MVLLGAFLIMAATLAGAASSNAGWGNDVVEVPSYGASASLGELYDIRKGKVVKGFSLFNKEKMKETVMVSKIGTSKFDTHDSKASMLEKTTFGIDASARVNILSGLVETTGRMKDMMEETFESSEERVYHSYGFIDRDEWLDMTALLGQNGEYAPHPKQGYEVTATHVIVGIRYGIEGYFARKKKSGSNVGKSSSALEFAMDLQELPDFHFGGGKKVGITMDTEQSREMSDLSVVYHSDVDFLNMFNEGTQGRALQANNDSIPKVFFLAPLQDVEWDRSLPFKINVAKSVELPETAMERLADILHSLLDTKLYIKLLAEQYPELSDAIKLAHEHLAEANKLRDYIKEMLPSVRDGTEPISTLIEACDPTTTPFRHPEWVKNYVDLLPDLASLVRGIEMRVGEMTRQGNVRFSWTQGRGHTKGEKCLFLYVDIVKLMPPSCCNVEEFRDNFDLNKRDLLLGVSNLTDYVQTNIDWVNFVIANRRLPTGEMWKIEYFHNDLPTPIPERPQLNRIQFKCSFRGLEIWYEFEHPDGSRIDKREIWFYKKEVGPASSTFAEEYEGEPGHCYRHGVGLDIGSNYVFRLEARFPTGFWVPSTEVEQTVGHSCSGVWSSMMLWLCNCISVG